MREIGYRAWDKETKKMVYGPNSFQSWLGPQMTFDGRIYESVKSDVPGMGMYKYRDVILMQYVNLTDKNGNRIYEGDILGGQFGDGYIAWCDICRAFQYHASNFCFACEGDLHWYELVEENGKLEVLGNVYENPGLVV